MKVFIQDIELSSQHAKIGISKKYRVKKIYSKIISCQIYKLALLQKNLLLMICKIFFLFLKIKTPFMRPIQHNSVM